MCSAGDEESRKPWLKDVVTPIRALSLGGGLRKRPLIYVYDTLPEFNTNVQQYRSVGSDSKQYPD